MGGMKHFFSHDFLGPLAHTFLVILFALMKFLVHSFFLVTHPSLVWA